VTLKVLIIDENPKNTELYNDLPLNGFSVEKVNFGKEIDSRVQEFDPDIIIIDAYQPKGKTSNSYWNLRAICKAPILVISVVDEPGIVEKILDRGADEYLVKPVSSSLLAARINALARRRYKRKSSRSVNN
jgi:DNA-binding response OmpR family regulator